MDGVSFLKKVFWESLGIVDIVKIVVDLGVIED